MAGLRGFEPVDIQVAPITLITGSAISFLTHLYHLRWNLFKDQKDYKVDAIELEFDNLITIRSEHENDVVVRQYLKGFVSEVQIWPDPNNTPSPDKQDDDPYITIVPEYRALYKKVYNMFDDGHLFNYNGSNQCSAAHFDLKDLEELSDLFEKTIGWKVQWEKPAYLSQNGSYHPRRLGKIKNTQFDVHDLVLIRGQTKIDVRDFYGGWALLNFFSQIVRLRENPNEPKIIICSNLGAELTGEGRRQLTRKLVQEAKQQGLQVFIETQDNMIRNAVLDCIEDKSLLETDMRWYHMMEAPSGKYNMTFMGHAGAPR